MHLTPEKILSMAPDIASVERARECAFAWRWQLLEGTERVLWGEYKTPGKPFYTAVDLDGPGFRCSCPSRKHPCKHALGLALLIFQSPEFFKAGNEIPADVEKWIAARNRRFGKTEQINAASQTAEVREEHKAVEWSWDKIISPSRLHEMKAGVEELGIWLEDLVRQGIKFQSESWDYIAKRMVDGKLSGIARRIRMLGEMATKDEWHLIALKEIGAIHLLAQGVKNLETLTTNLQIEVLIQAGASIRKETLKDQPGIRDTWQVVGQSHSLEENLRVRKTWLYGKKEGKSALILDFAFGNDPFESVLTPGTALNGTLVYYPGTLSLRAVLQEPELNEATIWLEGGISDLAEMAHQFKHAVSVNPWLRSFPVLLQKVTPTFSGKSWHLCDTKNQSIPLDIPSKTGWQLLAISSGGPIHLFGELGEEGFLPLSGGKNYRFFHL